MEYQVLHIKEIHVLSKSLFKEPLSILHIYFGALGPIM